jgi:ATP-dependent Clp protease ATP-binding subunit ClpA
VRNLLLLPLLLPSLLCVAPTARGQILGWGIRTAGINWMRTHGLMPCGFVENAVEVLDNETVGLRAHVQAQEWAVKAIVDAFEAQRPPSDRDHATLPPPMFLFFAGSTGVGKTFSAIQIANLIQDTDRGPVLIRSENYVGASVEPAVYHRQIQQLLQQKLSSCRGRHVVIFDEVQKLTPRTLDVFNPILEHGEFEFLDDNGKVSG